MGRVDEVSGYGQEIPVVRRPSVHSMRLEPHPKGDKLSRSMSPEEVTALKQTFSESLEPVTRELRAIHEALDEHGRLLKSIDVRLTNVEGILDGVEIMVRKKTG
jgi:hypothetical protein